MLSKKELKDFEKCYQNKISCSKCSMDSNGDCNEKVVKTALEYRIMLERHIWHKRSSDGKEFCIECRNLKEHGHTKDCGLQAMLKEG